MVKVTAMLTNEEYAIYSNICKVVGLEPSELAQFLVREGMLYMDALLKSGFEDPGPDPEDL